MVVSHYTMHRCCCRGNMHRCCCRGNMHPNYDSKSGRRTPNAWRVILNGVDVRGGQSTHDNKSHNICLLQAECVTINGVLRHRLHGICCLEDPVSRQSAGIWLG